MRNNTAFLRLPSNNLQGNITKIISCIAPKKKRWAKKVKPFIIVNTDVGRGLYTHELIRLLTKYSLEQQYNNKNLSQLRSKDVIVFGDSERFDFRVETNVNNFEDLDSNGWKIYELVKDFTKIIKQIQSYVYSNQNELFGDFDIYGDNWEFDYPRLRKQRKQRKVNTIQSIICNDPSNRMGNYNFFNNLRKRYYEEPEDFAVEIEVKEVGQNNWQSLPRLKKNANRCKAVNFYSNEGFEEARVHENWVKIGYNQYDIALDRCNNEYITLEDDTQLFIAEDRFGRRKLQV